jgi:thiol:disulfide interchange protein DsbD
MRFSGTQSRRLPLPVMSILLRLLVVLCLCAAGLARALTFQPSVVETGQVRAELLAHAPEGVAPGKTIWLGLAIDHQPHWHTYWKNPGDSGLPTTLAWTLPAGVTAGEIDWPTPKRLPVGPLMNFGHEGRLLLPVPLTIGTGFAAPTLDIKLRADWLVCKEVCIPESGEFALQVPAQAATAVHGPRFEAAWAQRPAEQAGTRAQARIEGGALVLTVQGLPAALKGQVLEFFPEQGGVIDNAAAQNGRWDGDAWQARIVLSPQRTESPERMAAVVAMPGVPGLRLDMGITGPWPAVGSTPAPGEQQAGAAAPGPAPQPATAPDAGPASLGVALLLAFAGGLLLNLMPCVFPVLSLKVMGFASHAHDRRALLAGGLAYTLGVVASFVALAGLLLALRAGGEQIGWGFQLQSPAFVALLAVLFTVIGLNLAGVFEFGNVLPAGVGGLRLRHPLADHALTGVLAVAVASPCTAPFMGAALGAAFTLPAPLALAVFASLGGGMAAPYLAAAAWPRLAGWLPRPGAWMVHFRAAMAFPMFATVVWLLWVLGHQLGVDAATSVLALLVAVGFLAWALAARDMARTARSTVVTLSLALLAATAWWAAPSLHDDAGPPGRQDAVAASAGPAQGSPWQPWSPQAVSEATASGRLVFVDFTAAWCVTCQFNKKTVLADATLLADFELKNVALMRADWTRRDAAITAELARLGRSGVPVYAVYRPGSALPTVLSELPSVAEIRAAIAPGT